MARNLRKLEGIKAVFFDLDNTLLNFIKMKTLAVEAAIMAMRDTGLNITLNKAKRIIKELFRDYGYEHQRIFNLFLQKVLGKVDYKILSAAIVAYRKVKEGFLEPYPNVFPTLIELIKRGYKLGIITDADRLQAWTRLAGMKLHHFFDIVVTSSDVKAKKPSLRLFKTALRKAGVKPREAVFVGDDPWKDIAGAKKVGMYTVFAKYGYIPLPLRVHKPSDKKMVKPDFVIKEISELLEILP